LCHTIEHNTSFFFQSNVNNARQFKLMEEFRVCTVEAQAATEDIRDEISTVVSTFNSRHQNVCVDQ